MPGYKECLLEFEGVSFAYPGGKPVISDFGATVEQGEFIAIIGPNGSGKSTLAGLAAGIFVPSAGRVTVDGMNTADPNAKEQIRRRVGLVLQNPDNQLVAARVEEDVAFGPENLNLPPLEVRQRVEYALEAVGLNLLRDRPPHLLSGGEKQRLAIAGLLALRPRCLVLDEPTSMLDPPGRREVLRVLHNLKAQGTSVLLVTHHMEEASAARRVWVIGNGKLLADGSPGTVFGCPDLLQQLGLTPPRAAQLAHCLAMRGVPVPDGIANTEDMVHFLCRALK